MKRFYTFLICVVLFNSAQAFGPPTTCDELPRNFAAIKSNLEAHIRAMSDSEIESAVVKLEGVNGRSLNREYALLATRFYNDIENWNKTADTCIAINTNGLYEEMQACDEVKSANEAELSKLSKKTSEPQERANRFNFGKILGARRYAKCFVSYEEQLFAQPVGKTLGKLEILGMALRGFPLNVTLPKAFRHSKRQLAGRTSKIEPFCDPEGAKFELAALKGNASAGHQSSACLFIQPVDHVKYDAVTNRFSIEDTQLNIEAATRDNGKADIAILSHGKKAIRGVPIYYLSLDYPNAKRKLNTLYAFDGEKVWEAMQGYFDSCTEESCLAVWRIFLQGL